MNPEKLTIPKALGIAVVLVASAWLYFGVPAPPCLGPPSKCDLGGP